MGETSNSSLAVFASVTCLCSTVLQLSPPKQPCIIWSPAVRARCLKELSRGMGIAELEDQNGPIQNLK